MKPRALDAAGHDVLRRVTSQTTHATPGTRKDIAHGLTDVMGNAVTPSVVLFRKNAADADGTPALAKQSGGTLATGLLGATGATLDSITITGGIPGATYTLAFDSGTDALTITATLPNGTVDVASEAETVVANGQTLTYADLGIVLVISGTETADNIGAELNATTIITVPSDALAELLVADVDATNVSVRSDGTAVAFDLYVA